MANRNVDLNPMLTWIDFGETRHEQHLNSINLELSQIFNFDKAELKIIF